MNALSFPGMEGGTVAVKPEEVAAMQAMVREVGGVSQPYTALVLRGGGRLTVDVAINDVGTALGWW